MGLSGTGLFADEAGARQLFSTAYDCTIRRTNFETKTSEEVIDGDVFESECLIHSLDFTPNGQEIWGAKPFPACSQMLLLTSSPPQHRITTVEFCIATCASRSKPSSEFSRPTLGGLQLTASQALGDRHDQSRLHQSQPRQPLPRRHLAPQARDEALGLAQALLDPAGRHQGRDRRVPSLDVRLRQGLLFGVLRSLWNEDRLDELRRPDSRFVWTLFRCLSSGMLIHLSLPVWSNINPKAESFDNALKKPTIVNVRPPPLSSSFAADVPTARQPNGSLPHRLQSPMGHPRTSPTHVRPPSPLRAPLTSFANSTAGNMDRKLDLISSSGEMLAQLYDDEFVTAVPAVTASHPTLPDRYYGGTGAGKVSFYGVALE